MKKKLFTWLLMSSLLLPLWGNSQDLVFQFRNPAFGGETFNYQWLLSSAQAQDTYEGEEDLFEPYTSNPLDDFENSLNRQILSQLSRKIIDSQFGEGDLEEGSYMLGNYQIEIGEGGDGMSIVIFDLTTGDQSTIFIPYF